MLQCVAVCCSVLLGAHRVLPVCSTNTISANIVALQVDKSNPILLRTLLLNLLLYARADAAFLPGAYGVLIACSTNIKSEYFVPPFTTNLTFHLCYARTN